MGRIHRILWTSLWFQFLVYPRRNVPLTEVGETQEQGFPWRMGKCRVFRVPFTKRAVALGKWTGYQPRETIDGIPTLTFKELPHWEDYTRERVQQDEGQDRVAG
jgi:hypothetical protein